MATNRAYASFQEIYDFHTEVGNTTLIEVHTPISDLPQRMLNGFFIQFRKFRYAGADVTLVPVSTLPADPLQISYEAGEPTIDPRDMVNPILWKGMSGASMGRFLDAIFGAHRSMAGQALGDVMDNSPSDETDFYQLFGDSLSISESTVFKALTNPDAVSALESMYYQGLADNSWNKAGVQTGFKKRGLFPLLWRSATNMFRPATQNTPPNPTGTGTPWVPQSNVDESKNYGYNVIHETGSPLTPSVGMEIAPGHFYNGATRLGWIPTQTSYDMVGEQPSNANAVNGAQDMTILPLIPMMKIILPTAYKTEIYFRMVIKHKFEFAEFANTVGPDTFSNNQNVNPAFIYTNVTSGASVATTTEEQPKIVTAGVA
ncbi:cap protein [Human associated porprismacovirus 1]|uniref:Cap protein n=1 Tax=Human associated porprismacovirus 1 TaxID=2170113 RepID=A0A9E7P6W7_9VIRU|nr:cap protein [Human associated porprismacovirus 1]